MGVYIPKKLRVGFVKRDGTFNGQLAYVIYYDEKGKLRKETSFNNWRDESIKAIELDNVPANFVLNKGITRVSYDWRNHARTMIRIWDNRDFEFEISVDNLMGILMHSDVSKRDILEPCVFAWDGQELLLLPVNSEAYQEAMAHTAKQGLKLTAKDLEPGKRYSFKSDEEPALYLGQYEFAEKGYSKKFTYKGKSHVFSRKSKYDFQSEFFIAKPEQLAECLSPEVEADFPLVLERFTASGEYTNATSANKLSFVRLAKDAKWGYLPVYNDLYLKWDIPDTGTITYRDILEQGSYVNISEQGVVRAHDFGQQGRGRTGWESITEVSRAVRTYDYGPEKKPALLVDSYFRDHPVCKMMESLESLPPRYTQEYAETVLKLFDKAVNVEDLRKFMLENKFKTCYNVKSGSKVTV